MTTRLKTTHPFFTQFQSDETGFEIFVGPEGDPLNGVTVTVRRDARRGIRVHVEKRGSAWVRFVSERNSTLNEFLVGRGYDELRVFALIGATGSVLSLAILIFGWLRFGL